MVKKRKKIKYITDPKKMRKHERRYNVKGHYRIINGKKVYVKPHSRIRRYAHRKLHYKKYKG